jgi:hypothetical protein
LSVDRACRCEAIADYSATDEAQIFNLLWIGTAGSYSASWVCGEQTIRRTLMKLPDRIPNPLPSGGDFLPLHICKWACSHHLGNISCALWSQIIQSGDYDLHGWFVFRVFREVSRRAPMPESPSNIAKHAALPFII